MIGGGLFNNYIKITFSQGTLTPLIPPLVQILQATGTTTTNPTVLSILQKRLISNRCLCAIPEVLPCLTARAKRCLANAALGYSQSKTLLSIRESPPNLLCKPSPPLRQIALTRKRKRKPGEHRVNCDLNLKLKSYIKLNCGLMTVRPMTKNSTNR